MSNFTLKFEHFPWQADTLKSVQAQMRAMGLTRYDIGIRDEHTGKMQRRYWDGMQMIAGLKFLRYQNAHAGHIYIRPSIDCHNLTLLDDLDYDKVAYLYKVQMQPCVVVETSPNNYQAWLKHAFPLEKAISTKVAQWFAHRFGADISSADYKHYGRLAGFTNPKLKYQDENGRFPYSLLREASGVAYSNIDFLNQAINDYEQALQKQAESLKSRAENITRYHNQHHNGISPNDNPVNGILTIQEFHQKSSDLHLADITYARYAIAHGCTESQIVDAILGARDLSKKGSIERQIEYALRTAKRAFNDVSEGVGV